MTKSDTRATAANQAGDADPPPAAAEPRLMIIEKADVVVSLNGRDEGKRFIVVGTEDGYSLIADGKGRVVSKPKRKKNKHLKLEDKADSLVALKLNRGEKVTNNEIRRALAQYAAARGEQGGM